MRGGHRGAGDGVLKESHVSVTFFFSNSAEVAAYGSRGAADPGAQDVAAGGLNVDNGAVVGVVGLGVGLIGGSHGADGGLGGGRGVRRVDVLVAGGDGQEDACIHESGRGPVDGGRVASAKGHVRDGAVGAVAVGCVIGDEVDAGDHTRAEY